VQGLREIRAANKAEAGPNYRVQRDRLAQVLRKVLAERGIEAVDVDTTAKADARKVLYEIYGDRK
jgi:hypothetical protein